MYLKELESIGLTPREIKVYIALLEVGSSSVGKIIKKSGIPSSKIYETLEKLKSKGFVSSIIDKNRQQFNAVDPKSILDYLKEETRRIAETVIPKLEEIKQKPKKEKTSTIFEGIRGMKLIYEKMLRTTKRGDTIYVMGASQAQELLEDYLINFNKRRIKLGVKMDIIFYEDARKYGKIREGMPLTRVRYLKKEQVSPAWFDLFNDNLVIFDLKETPTSILITDENITKSFREYFTFLWKSAERL